MYDNNKYDHYYYCDFLKSYGPNNVLAYLLLYYICMHILSICSYHHIHSHYVDTCLYRQRVLMAGKIEYTSNMMSTYSLLAGIADL